MKKKLLMALLVGVLAVPSSVSCFAADLRVADAAAADSDEEEETERQKRKQKMQKMTSCQEERKFKDSW